MRAQDLLAAWSYAPALCNTPLSLGPSCRLRGGDGGDDRSQKALASGIRDALEAYGGVLGSVLQGCLKQGTRKNGQVPEKKWLPY